MSSSDATTATPGTLPPTSAGDEHISADELNRLRQANREKRFAQLGFHPQHEMRWNKLLPYISTAELDAESQEQLAAIKANLGRAVACRELDPSLWMWIDQLCTYLDLYGFKFSLEDHVNLVHVVLSLLEIPFLEPSRLFRVCQLASSLLGKLKFISPADMQIEWRPLYRLVNIYIDLCSSKNRLYRFGSGNESTIIELIEKASTYFPPGSTQELLDELLPRLLPLIAGNSCDTFCIISTFVGNTPDYQLWLPHFLDLWATYQNPVWNQDLMNMLTRLAVNHCGRIDWEPHMPMLYTRILRSLKLPVFYMSIRGSVDQSLGIEAIAEFIAYTLGPRSSSQAHFGQLLGSVKSFVQPANSGKYTLTIGKLAAQVAEHVVRRLRCERLRPHPWREATPPGHRLTDDCVTAFVESMRPFAQAELFSRVKITDIGHLFNRLAELRPALIIPELLDRVYATLDALTEPRKLTAALQCLLSVSRAMVAGHDGYTAGRTHVIPLLFAVLPGIDANDFRKTTITLEFITSLAILVPIVDCSRAGEHWTDLTDEERIICDQTAEFESFVLQFLDRLFAVIQASAQLPTRMEQTGTAAATRSKMEVMSDVMLLGSMQGILGQCSAAIVAAATEKMCTFVQENLFETNVAAPMAGSLVLVAARHVSVPGDHVQRVFFPWLVRVIHAYIDEHEDCATVEKQSDELQYYLTLLESYVQGNGIRVLDAVDETLRIFDRVRHFKYAPVTRRAHSIIAHLMRSLSFYHPFDVRTSPDSFALPLAQCLPVRRWAEKSVTPLAWYRPDEHARAACERILHRYLPTYVAQFNGYVDGQLQLTRDELERDVKALIALLQCPQFLPDWSEPPLYTDEHCVTDRAQHAKLRVRLGTEHLVIRMPDGENVRLVLVRCLGRLQAKLLADSEGTRKTCESLTYVWELLHWKRHVGGRQSLQRSLHTSKKMYLETALSRRPLEIRSMVAARIMLLHEYREFISWPPFSGPHLTVMRRLLELGTSPYSAVRRLAQDKLQAVMNKYPRAYRWLLDDLVAGLAVDVNAEHARFKGVLFVLLQLGAAHALVDNDLVLIERLWPALLCSQPSEKPSIVTLMSAIQQMLNESFTTSQVGIDIPQCCVEAGVRLAGNGPAAIGPAEIAAGLERMREQSEANETTYRRIQLAILAVTQTRSLHWRYVRLATHMLTALVHPQSAYPIEVVQYAVNNLIHETVAERNLAVGQVRCIMLQIKREFLKRPLDAQANAIAAPHDRPNLRRIAPGVRPDNRWLQYDRQTVPRSQADWDEPRFVHKTTGFFGWQPNFGVYAPTAEQPAATRERHELSAVERVLYDFVCDDASFERLVQFWSLEGRRGDEQFHRSRMSLAKSLVTQFGWPVVERLMAHAERLIALPTNVEANHRCAAEFVGAIVRGIKHWPYADTARLYEERVVPLVRLVMNTITSETDGIWGTCMATAVEHMAPQRQWWLHEVLLEDPLREERSNVNCTRVYCLQGAYNQHVWRMNTVSHRLLDYVRPYLDHPFQNVRNRIGSLLINIFETDLEFPDANAPECPRIGDFIDELLPRFDCLYNEAANVAAAIAGRSGDATADADALAGPDSAMVAEYKAAIRLFKVICHWITGIMNRCTNGNRAEFFKLLPLACYLNNKRNDEELLETINSLLAILAQALTSASVMPVALDAIEAITHEPKWSSRCTALAILQILVFNNLPMVLSQPLWVQQVQAMVLRLMTDPIVEVRQKAFAVLSGMLHCSFLPDTDKLLEMFKSKSRTKVPKLKRGMTTATPPRTAQPKPVMCTTAAAASAASSSAAATAAVSDAEASGGQLVPNETEPMRQRLMGVMGLCAFIGAHPYEVPDFVPDVIEQLGPHLNAPELISSTIRVTINSFKRTHHDDWLMHKQKFTENQLAVLSDLTSPPSYYA